jgi:1-acyl-sn-glycerol-3-phosphate acyltransferase
VIAWHGAEAGGANVLRILARTRPIRVTARFLPPLAGQERANRKTMAAAAQRRIGQALALPPALSESPPIA